MMGCRIRLILDNPDQATSELFKVESPTWVDAGADLRVAITVVVYVADPRS